MRALFCSYYRFPNGDAGATRQEMLSYILNKLGYDVTVAAMGEYTKKPVQHSNGIKYISFRSKNNDKISKLKNYLLYKKKLKDYLYKNKFDVILVVDIPFNALLYIKKYAKKNGVPVIHDSVEWYSREEFKCGIFDISFIRKNILNRFLIGKSFSVIAISQYLKNHFEKRCKKAVRIPFVLNCNEIEYVKKPAHDKIVLMYAGNPGKKDLIEPVFEALNMLDNTEREKIEFRIIGINGLPSSNIPDCVKFYGRLPRADVLKHYAQADFTVLLRQADLRYAKAGFPTKVTESLSYATPVITNYTSDLELYLKNEENALISKSHNAKDIYEVLKKAVDCDKTTLEEMYKNAYNTAKEYLDYNCFCDELKYLLEE